MIGEELRRKVERFTSGLTIPWERINLHVGRLPAGQVTGRMAFPRVFVKRPVTVVTQRGYARNLVAVGMTIGRDIYIEPGHANFNTASGQALLVHELIHVSQGERDPDFQSHYEEAEINTPPGQPWLNPYEREAYWAERNAYCQMVAEGVPKGKWQPLGVMLWGCQ